MNMRVHVRSAVLARVSSVDFEIAATLNALPDRG